MGRKIKRKKTLKTKRVESFVTTTGMTPREFLDKLDTLPNRIRHRANIREAKALV